MRRLLLAAIRNLSVAAIIGTVIILPFFLWYVPVDFEQHIEFTSAPPTDDALREWLSTQPHGHNCEIKTRTQSELHLECSGPGIRASFPQMPPWSELGYEINSEWFYYTWHLIELFQDPTSQTVIFMSSQVGFLAVAYWQIRRARKEETPLPALFSGGVLKPVVYGVALGCIMLGFGFLYDEVLKAILGPDIPQTNIWGAIRSVKGAARIGIMLWGSLVAPICEELFFRGVLFGSFVAAGRARIGTLISAALFALMHLDPINFLPIFVFGSALAWLSRKTESILSVTAAHAVNNAVAIMLLFLS